MARGEKFWFSLSFAIIALKVISKVYISQVVLKVMLYANVENRTPNWLVGYAFQISFIHILLLRL